MKRLRVRVKPQRTASCLFLRSVTSINPGACVIANGSFAAAITACGVTPQSVIAAAKVPFAITHSPGLMLVTDLQNKALAVL